MISPENRVLKKLDILITHNIEHSALSADYVCKEVGVSRSQLHRILKQETQLSLSLYIRKKRIEKAKKLLSNTQMRIAEVAFAVGINSHQNFAKYFKSDFGISPTEFRVNHTEKLESPQNRDNSIAVLPFVNFSNDKDQEYFSDGITEEIINVLAQVPELKVVGRTSSFAFKNKNEDLRAIGKSLGVHHLLEGSVRKAGNRLRITAQLVKVSDGYHLWSHNYECEIKDLFDIQDEISAAILSEIKDELLGGITHKVNRRTERSTEAHEYYLKGLYYLNQYSNEANFRKAIEYFEKALEVEPDYVECLSEMASCYIQLWFFSQIEAKSSVEIAKTLIDKALALDDPPASLLVREAHLKIWYFWDLKGAKTLLEKALKTIPNDVEAHMQLSVAMTYLRDFDLAEEHILKCITIDPLSAVLQFSYAWTMWYKNDLDKCEQIIDKLISFKPRFWGGHYLKAVVYLETQRSDKALEFAEESAALYPSSMTYALVAQTHLLNGDFDKTREIVANIEHHMNLFPVANFDLGHLYLGLGEFEKSRDYFQKALDAHEGRMLFLLPSCRKIPFIQKHPYFKPFFDQMKVVSSI